MDAVRFLDLLLDECTDGVLVAAIEALYREHVPEGLRIEYKRGELFSDAEFGEKTRRAASALLNSDGGVLVIGIDAPKQRPEAWAGVSLALDDATKRLSDVLAELGIVARRWIRGVETTEGHRVVVVACPRSPTLIPARHKGELRYFVRVEDAAREVPPYLLADLLVGRRALPSLDVEMDVRANESHPRDSDRYFIDVRVTNRDLTWARDVAVGLVVACSAFSQYPDRQRESPVTPWLLQRVTIQPNSTPRPGQELRLAVGYFDNVGGGVRSKDLAPFEQLSAVFAVSLGALNSQSVLLAGGYAAPGNGLPVWAQLRAYLQGQSVGDRQSTLVERPMIWTGSRDSYDDLPVDVRRRASGG